MKAKEQMQALIDHWCLMIKHLEDKMRIVDPGSYEFAQLIETAREYKIRLSVVTEFENAFGFKFERFFDVQD
jgi:hypothetical protein